MNSKMFECEICDNDFDSFNHKPLSLRCGHTFCEKCVKRKKDPKGITCPTCSSVTKQLPQHLPVILALIRPASKTENSSENPSKIHRCASHDRELQYLCLDCDDLTCWKSSRDSHMSHRVEPMVYVANNDAMAETRGKLRNKVQEQHDTSASQLATLQAVLGLTDEMAKCKTDFVESEKILRARKKLMVNGLKTLDSITSNSPKANTKMLTEMIHQMKIPQISEDAKLVQTFVKFDKLCIKYPSLEGFQHNPSNTCEQKSPLITDNTAQLLPDKQLWMISTNADTQSALVSVRAGRKPSSLTVVSSPAAPIKRLPEVLDYLRSACKDVEKVSLVVGYWERKLDRNDSVLSFIKEHGQYISMFYGCPNDAVAACLARGQSGLDLGVRLASLADLACCAKLTLSPRSVSCILGLPSTAGNRIKEMGWLPWLWHFPDVQDNHVDWALSLASPSLEAEQNRSRYYTCLCLPRCLLTEEAFLTLINRCPSRSLYIYCESTSLTEESKSRLTAHANGRCIYIKWTLPLHTNNSY